MSQAMQQFNQSLQQSKANVADRALAQGNTLVQMSIGGVMQSMALQQYRDLNAVVERVTAEAKLSAENMMYRWTVKKKDGTKDEIKGLSIDAAMVLARNYGNCAAWADLVSETETHWTMVGYFVDRETGFISMRQFRQRKTESHGKFDADRQLDIAFQIGQSKAIRNAVVHGMPEKLKHIIEETAERAVAEELISGGMADAIKKVEKTFAKFDIDRAKLEHRLKKPVAQWGNDELVALRGIYQSIVDGVTSAENEFETPPAQTQAEAADDLLSFDEPAPKTKAEPAPKTKAEPAPKTKAEPAPKTKAEPAPEPPEPPEEIEKPVKAGTTIVPTENILRAYDAMGFSQGELEKLVLLPVDKWGEDEKLFLLNTFKQLRSGETSREKLFPPLVTTETPAQDLFFDEDVPLVETPGVTVVKRFVNGGKGDEATKGKRTRKNSAKKEEETPPAANDGSDDVDF
jgi:hypothetical protein